MMTNLIAAAIAAEMAGRSLTDRQAGELLEVAQPTITRWRTGKAIPRPHEAVKLAAFLHIGVGDVDRMILNANPRRPAPAADGPETVGRLIRELEVDRGLTPVEMMRLCGVDKSRFYRLRSDAATPHLADVPELARRLNVDDERLALAAYRTEINRVAHPRASSRVVDGDLAPVDARHLARQ